MSRLGRSGAERRRYLAQGLREIVDLFGERAPARPLRLNLKDPEVRSKIAEGASPLRVYTGVLARHVIATQTDLSGVIGDFGCGEGRHACFF